MKRSMMWVLCGGLMAMGWLVLAEEPVTQPWVNVFESEEVLSLEPDGVYQEFTLRISGPENLSFEMTFSGSDVPFLHVFDLDGEPLADGSYTYELIATPLVTAKTRDLLQKARASGDDAEVARLQKEGKLPRAPEPYTGYFTVVNGKIVQKMEELPYWVQGHEASIDGSPQAAAKDGPPVDQDDPGRDVVHVDDVIVDGSLCVGVDCVNGENFGFDTIRLKENNLRIKFQDTSNSGSFPTSDWQITANDSTNGGANKFSIDDVDAGRTPFTIEANAPNNALYVDDGGRVGLGTATPVVELHVQDGDTPTLRLEQDGSSGFTPQTWDVAGNEANFFVRDVTNASKLPFKIKPGAGNDSLVIEADDDVLIKNGNLHVASGAVGVGTETPAATLDVQSANADTEATFNLTVKDEQVWQIKTHANTGKLNIVDITNDTTPLKIEPGAPNSSFTMTATGTVGIGTGAPNANAKLDVDGPIYQRGSSLHADYVFAVDYELESIEDHAEFMWENQHLPAVPARETAADGAEIVDIGAQRRGILEELEKAHIYIERLNEEMKQLRQDLETLRKESSAD